MKKGFYGNPYLSITPAGRPFQADSCSLASAYRRPLLGARTQKKIIYISGENRPRTDVQSKPGKDQDTVAWWTPVRVSYQESPCQ